MATKKQLQNRARFKKVMAEAKKLRAKKKNLSQADAVKQAWKNIGAIKIIEKGESKNTKPKATYQYKRSAKGTFKGLKKVGAIGIKVGDKFKQGDSIYEITKVDKNGVEYAMYFKGETKKDAYYNTMSFNNLAFDSKFNPKNKIGATGSHKDTKSHNVNIRVLSGYKKPMYTMGNVDMKKLVTQFGKENKLKKDVVTILLRKVKDYDNNYKSLFKDILYNGLQSGIVGELIYYSDTTKWYKKHKKDIISLLKETMDSYGTNTPQDLFGNKWDSSDYLIEDTQNQNLLAWFSFEETTRELADRMGIEI